jgi:hypothetical protein
MTNIKKRLEGRVAAILNSRELVINIGDQHGVTHGMKFAVLAESALEIRDPESGEVLDTIDREKVRVEVSELRKNISICRTYRLKKIPGGPLGEGMLKFGNVADLVRPPREIPETLSIHDASIPPPLPEEESYVKVKDRVVQVAGE